MTYAISHMPYFYQSVGTSFSSVTTLDWNFLSLRSTPPILDRFLAVSLNWATCFGPSVTISFILLMPDLSRFGCEPARAVGSLPRFDMADWARGWTSLAVSIAAFSCRAAVKSNWDSLP